MPMTTGEEPAMTKVAAGITTSLDGADVIRQALRGGR
jgi:hypothetical protein